MSCGQYTEEIFEQNWSKVGGHLKPIDSTFLEINQSEGTALISTKCCRINLATNGCTVNQIITEIDLKTHKTENISVDQKFKSVQAWSSDRSLVAKLFKSMCQGREVYYIEIWSKDTLKRQISLADQTLHEGLYGKSCVLNSDEKFASIVWSSDCTKLYYLAETQKHDSESKEQADSFGEALSNVFKPQIFCLDIETRDISKAVTLPEHLYPLKLFYKNNRLYFLATRFADIKHTPVFCVNHPKQLYVMKDDGTIENLTPDGRSVWFCVFNPEFPMIFLFEINVIGELKFKFDLMVMEIEGNKRTCAFGGINSTALTENCWLNSKDSPGIAFMVYSDISKTKKLCVVKRIDGTWKSDEFETMECHNYDLLSVTPCKDDKPTFLCLLRKSSFVTPWKLVISKLSFSDSQVSFEEEIEISFGGPTVDLKVTEFIKTFYFDDDRKMVAKEQGVVCGILVLPPGHKGSTLDVIAFSRCLMMQIHEYNYLYHLLHLSDFALYFVTSEMWMNKKQKNSESIFENIADRGVEDFHLSFQAVCKSTDLKIGNICVFGECFGGYLASQLIIKYPDFYKGAILQNSPLNFPDWYTSSDAHELIRIYTNLPDSSIVSLEIEELEKLYKMSPIYHADKIKCPILLIASTESVLIPMQQSLQCYRNLKSRNQDVKLLIYKDKHGLLSHQHQKSISLETIKFFSKISASK
ncbi:Acylamino-acid-releasing enzyme [Thelohanellus kitauei]|uniref:Acylamino-acid-releasing enzyme n=1 Tax=Thelohanellus kitauei TaxID=669202 RepID=A0A0C2MNJ2_THEKT|nr:Acylamino-acid-releasing enzyme [Thelohanellus kitauei]